MSIATCGHEIESGISTSVDDGQTSWDGKPCITYGTYCDKCILMYYKAGKLENKELKALLDHVKKKGNK